MYSGTVLLFVHDDELEQIQRRASKIVYFKSGTLSTVDILEKLGWETFHERRVIMSKIWLRNALTTNYQSTCPDI